MVLQHLNRPGAWSDWLESNVEQLTFSRRPRCPRGATPEQRLRHYGWTVVQRRDGMTPCWEWNGRPDGEGYCRIWDGARTVLVHRLAFTVWVRPLKPGEQVCHRCDWPSCLNPEHLFTGAVVDNMADMVVKRRSCNGENRPTAKLTDSQVAAIRAAYTGAWGQQTELARAYGISTGHINKLLRGSTRARPTNPPLTA